VSEAKTNVIVMPAKKKKEQAYVIMPAAWVCLNFDNARARAEEHSRLSKYGHTAEVRDLDTNEVLCRYLDGREVRP
jgi:hypothetical protein